MNRKKRVLDLTDEEKEEIAAEVGRKRLKAVAQEGGKKRWEGVSPEERSRITKEWSKKAAEARSKKAKLKK